ncbi:MAG: ATP-binding cassette domain-containing protein [Saprospiraceae bacterium]|nr:ATP-binding cassette domain-containing protein [Saprospiraceae bacterium]
MVLKFLLSLQGWVKQKVIFIKIQFRDTSHECKKFTILPPKIKKKCNAHSWKMSVAPRKVLFKNVNLSISKGDKSASIAKNDSGKTTLLKVIGGEEGSDGENAKITISKRSKQPSSNKILYLTQMPCIGDYFDTDNEAIVAVWDYEKH